MKLSPLRDVLRAQGLGALVDEGRVAQKRILVERADGSVPEANDKQTRNRLRKTRRQAAKALAATTTAMVEASAALTPEPADGEAMAAPLPGSGSTTEVFFLHLADDA